MKPCSILCALLFALMAAGCADPLEQRSGQEVQSQLQRGVTGQGRLIDSESTNNPTAAPAASQTQPNYPPQ
jgi:hypothetical protein